eukprot:3758814-Alexandrium_andersonii.AAC.1
MCTACAPTAAQMLENQAQGNPPGQGCADAAREGSNSRNNQALATQTLLESNGQGGAKAGATKRCPERHRQ